MAFPVNLASNPQAMMTSLLRPITSDSDGKFELTSLQPGAYTIAANSPGYILSESGSPSFDRPGETVTLTLVKGGVITGRVTNSSVEPMVGASVRAIRIRDSDNKPCRAGHGAIAEFASDPITTVLGGFKTDDRGIYRIYGLAPGYYQVAAGGRGGRGFAVAEGAYDADAPTYFPSSTIDTAAEVTVQAGDEVTGIDIRYREHRGHSISGRVSGATGSTQETSSVLLVRANSGVVEATTFVLGSPTEKGFVFDAVLDGEYTLIAMASGANIEGGERRNNASLSQPRRVMVSGGDITGVELALEPLASIAGRAVIEPHQDVQQKPNCKSGRPSRVEEVVISTRGDKKPGPEENALGLLLAFKNTTPSETGEFALSYLRSGVHRLDVQLPSEALYVKSAMLQPSNSNNKPIDAARNGFALKSGDKIKGMVVTLSDGAAGLRGKVVTGEENKPPPVKMRVHMIPAEPEAADDVVRYFEAEVAADGGFSLTNLAPGKYWLVARETSDQEQSEADHKPAAWDAGARLGLRFEGDATKKVIELARCQRVTDLVLSYTPLIKPAKPPTKKPAL